MKQKDASRVRILAGLVPFLLVLSFFPGCVQNSAVPATTENNPVSQSTILSPAVSSSPGTPQNSVGSEPGTRTTRPINITIHSAFKTRKIRETFPKPGNIFVVINMTIKNPKEYDAYMFDNTTVLINGGGPITQKLYSRLTNPLYWGTIPPHEKRTGEVVFGVNGSTQSFTLRFLDTGGKVILTQEIGTIGDGYYSPIVVKDQASSFLPPGLIDSRNFTDVVENLDTPMKAAQYVMVKYTYKLHWNTDCTSYSPEEFFDLMTGDCSDVATFLSYVIAQHGYDANVVIMSYSKDGKHEGHVVTLFTDIDGRLKYATTPDTTIFREVSSVDDLISQECSRLGVPTIAKYAVYPAGSPDTCFH